MTLVQRNTVPPRQVPKGTTNQHQNAEFLLILYTHLPFRTTVAYKPDVALETEGMGVRPLTEITAKCGEGDVFATIADIAMRDYVLMDDYKELVWYVKNLLNRRIDANIKLSKVRDYLARVFGFEYHGDLKEFSNKHHPELVRNLRVKGDCCSERGDKPVLQTYLNQERVTRQPRNSKGE